MRIVTAASFRGQDDSRQHQLARSQQPPDGNQCNFCAKRKIRSKANQKFGIPMPAILIPVIA